MNNVIGFKQCSIRTPDLQWHKVCTTVLKSETNNRKFMIVSQGAKATLIVTEVDQTYIVSSISQADAKLTAERFEAIMCECQNIPMQVNHKC
jgi:hypothetical protein